jgi:hypothetical protein
MGEYFKPWRRKVGVLTLVLALALMVGWVRSLRITDMVVFPAEKLTNNSSVSFNRNTLLSATGSVIWVQQHTEYAEEDADFDQESYPVWVTNEPLSFDISLFKRRCCEFGVSEFNVERNGYRATYMQLPYWSITIPLTLIAAWLLLSKSRSANQKKIDEPVPTAGT